MECVWVKQPENSPKPVTVKQEKQVSCLVDETSACSVPSLRDQLHHAGKKWKQPTQAKKSTRPLKKEKLTEAAAAVKQEKRVCNLVNETSLPHRANNHEHSTPSKTKIIKRAAFEPECTRYKWSMQAKDSKTNLNDSIKRDIRRQFREKMIASGHISAEETTME